VEELKLTSTTEEREVAEKEEKRRRGRGRVQKGRRKVEAEYSGEMLLQRSGRGNRTKKVKKRAEGERNTFKLGMK
jgi:hypothetical protein